MMREIEKLSGIYQIRNSVNNKVYIGHSKNITLRWYTHICNLMNNQHDNHKLQEDFNKYGLAKFEFSILEFVKGKKELVKSEQKYLNGIDLNSNYNLINSQSPYLFDSNDEKRFIDYINSKWLLPKGITDKNIIEKYRIYRDDQKQEIVDMVIDCKLLKLYPSRITFNKVIDLMQNGLGYTIENGRFMFKNKRYTYKLVIDLDEEKINIKEGDINARNLSD